MKLSDSVNYSLTKVKRKKNNIYFIIILAICTAAMLGSMYYRNTFLKGLEPILEDKEIMISFTEDSIDYNSILNIEHIEDIYDFKYNLNYLTFVSLKNDKYTGQVWVRYGSNASIPKKIEGERLDKNDTGVAICPKYFYPTYNEKIDYLDKNMFIKGEDILNKTFLAIAPKYERINGQIVETGTYSKEFKIIGIYDQLENKKQANECYISEKDMIELYQANRNIDDYTSSTVIAIIDERSNIKTVTNELVKLGYEISSLTIPDLISTLNVKFITYSIIIIVTISILLLTILYTKKKNLDDQYELGLLKSLGYKNKDIKLIKSIEIIWISIISFILGLLFIGVIFLLLNTIFKNYLIYHHIIICHKLMPYIIIFAIIIIVPLITNYFYTYKSSKKKSANMLKEEKI